jgi:hypothetical protein
VKNWKPSHVGDNVLVVVCSRSKGALSQSSFGCGRSVSQMVWRTAGCWVGRLYYEWSVQVPRLRQRHCGKHLTCLDLLLFLIVTPSPTFYSPPESSTQPLAAGRLDSWKISMLHSLARQLPWRPYIMFAPI